MAGNTIDQLLTSIRHKEGELLDQEETYQTQRLEFERRAQDLDDRRHRLTALLEEERVKMMHLLAYYGASSDEAKEFYAQVQGLEDESEWAYRQSHQALEEEKDQFNRSYTQDKERIELELIELRRTYNELDD